MLWTELRNNNSYLDPWHEFNRLSRALTNFSSTDTYDFPAVNMWVDSNNAIVTSEVPGLEAKDIEISVVGKSLSIRGSRKSDDLGENESYHRKERWSGGFSKTLELPFNVQADKVEAVFRKGILKITLPRAESEKPKKIDITSE